MAGADGSRRLRGSVALGLVLVLLAPARVAADDGAVVLADRSTWSVGADLDADGAREVFLLRADGDVGDPAREYVAEAWGYRAGGWVQLGAAPVLRWDGGVDPGSRPVRVGPGEAIGLLVMSLDGAPTVLVASSIAEQSDQRATSCCLSFARVGLRDDALTLEPLAADFGQVESLAVLDVDADGTDELFVTEQTTYGDNGPGTSTYALLRQAGGSFRRETIVLPELPDIQSTVIGESDGLRGDDIVFFSYREQVLLRAFDDEGTLRVEAAGESGLIDPELGFWFAGAADGTLVLIEERGASLVRWPRGQRPARAGTLETAPFPSVLLLGEGAEARLVQLTGTDGATADPIGIRIYDLQMNLERYLPAPQLLNDVYAMTNEYSGPPLDSVGFLYPHIGEIPGGIDGRPAMFGYGSLIVIEADGSLRVEDAVSMVNASIVSAVGPDDEWLLAAPPWGGAGTVAYLADFAGDATRSMLSVVPLAEVLDPSGAADPPINVQGATAVGTGSDRSLVAPDGGFQVTVDGAPGTVVVVSAGRELTAEEITDGPVTLTVDPGGGGDRNRRFEASVVVVDPSGIASGQRWDAEILRENPELTVNTEAEPFALRTTVFGTVTPGSEVTVDGELVETNRSGAYRVDVDAPAWPRDVLVVARDPVGNETVERIEVIGFVDYRGFPWIPIFAVLTVCAGIVLFLRTPRLRPQAAFTADGDGRLEEIDGDPM